MKALVVAVGAGLLLAVLGACTGPKPLPPLAGRSPASTPPGCPPAGVAVHAGPVDAAMGLRAMTIDLVNCGERPYTVQGYPDVQVLDAGGRPLDVKVVRGTKSVSSIERFDGPPRRVTAAPGERLAAVVVWRNTVADGADPAVTGRHLRVTPADGGRAQTVTPEGGIDLGTTGRLAVSPWTTPPS